MLVFQIAQIRNWRRSVGVSNGIGRSEQSVRDLWIGLVPISRGRDSRCGNLPERDDPVREERVHSRFQVRDREKFPEMDESPESENSG